MRRVKIYGAGSIGNHLSHASRRLGFSVDLCDVDPAALQRTKESIYPGRYGRWDDEVKLHVVGKEPKGNYDYVFVGTPPDSHMKVARAAIAEGAKAILVEKPLCTPDLEGAQALLNDARAAGVRAFVGYDHVVGRAAGRAAELVSSGLIGRVVTLDVEFREHWGGIFAAHPWLRGPSETYLGYWRRGGGASGEHSHALNLWQFFANAAGLGRVDRVQAALTYVSDGEVEYDDVCLLNLKTSNGTVGRVVQDVVTEPPRKWARIQGTDGFVEWYCGYEPGVDLVPYRGPAKETGEIRFPKTRPDDFIREVQHLEAIGDEHRRSPISLERGLESMMVVAAAHKAAVTLGTISIDYKQGYVPSALLPSS